MHVFWGRGWDGSIYDARYKGMARGGWAVVQYREGCQSVGIFGPLPGWCHTILRAELGAVFQCLCRVIPPFCYVCDNETVLVNLLRGRSIVVLLVGRMLMFGERSGSRSRIFR